MSRKLSRIAMMKILFAMQHRDEFTDDVMESFFESEWDESELENIYRYVFSGKALEKRLDNPSPRPLSAEDVAYCREHIREFLQHRDEIDGLIEDNLRDWTLDHLAGVDASILRLAVYEFLYCPDIAPAISVDEAVNLAKMFSTKDSARFINGILGYILRNQS
ncbi:MAG: transcription antitermination factor NusB [Peptoniphilus sp.]|nr:transcription antitermination factor NusB [Peptoniphilus sp.]MDD7362911.1 transcription antitermination factor NusB [Bacillota bacterium]MDY6044151.1 transcription antitermination factor NusB [Peptoniphilus sp.]